MSKIIKKKIKKEIKIEQKPSEAFPNTVNLPVEPIEISVKKQISLINPDFGREDLNQLGNKLNEVINFLNK